MGFRECPLEALEMTRSFWRGKRVFVTGHTGFKGSWLSLWLKDMGAEVHGYSLEPLPAPGVFAVTHLHNYLSSSTIADIRDSSALAMALKSANPDVVFHLAAQALVRQSYAVPVETYEVNVMGTVNLLEAVRHTPGVRAFVNVTTDKCYENKEWVWPYRETEPLGGSDPYASSKACSELVASAYRRSFLNATETAVATARAGNVIGGGDCAADRLIPDFLRAMDSGKSMEVRSPDATRPWQHVLEPVSGYLTLAELLYERGQAFAEAWNFGPRDSEARSVQWILETLCREYPDARWHCEDKPHPHEALSLKLDSSKAEARLGWVPRWNMETALKATIAWHTAWKSGTDMTEFSLNQIHAYEKT